MDYKATFSYCLKNDVPDSKHQFHYQYDFEPTTVEFEQWLIGKLYSPIQIEKVGNDIISVDYGNPAAKEAQIEEFLDYHFSKYKGSLNSFNSSLRFTIELLKTHPDVKTDSLYYMAVNQTISDWWFFKADNRHITTKDDTQLTKSLNFTLIYKSDRIESLYDFLNGSYLSEISDKSHFYYVFGVVDRCINFKPLNWTKTLKDLNAFIDTFYSNEPRKWEKAVYCFTWNNNPIKKKSLSTAIDKYDNEPESKIHFEDLYHKLK